MTLVFSYNDTMDVLYLVCAVEDKDHLVFPFDQETIP